MNLYEARTGIVLKQRMIDEKARELTHLKDFLTPTLLKGRILSADALSTQKVFCQEVIASGGNDLLLVKRNQPTLHREFLTLLAGQFHDILFHQGVFLELVFEYSQGYPRCFSLGNLVLTEH